MNESERDDLAQEIYQLLQNNPRLEIPQLAEQLDVSEEEVANVLDSYLVRNKQVVYEGPGQGGNWIPEDVRQELVSSLLDGDRVIGYRWPDGTIQETPFIPEGEEQPA